MVRTFCRPRFQSEVRWSLLYCLPLLLFLAVSRGLLADDGVETTLNHLATRAEATLQERFELAGVDYPPQRIQLIALKQSRRLELWAYQKDHWRYVHDYAVFAASGEAGPKLREGDKQVPEGFYRIVELNPNSHFHLSMKLNYPNAFDWMQATREGREKPGSNIFIHGSAWSSGCLAIGNRYVEELFYLVGRVGLEQAGVLILPYDFRRSEIRLKADAPEWLGQLYAHLKLRMDDFPLAEKVSTCAYGCREARVRGLSRE
jgi:murein L,D-transpeptidase YafK